MEEPTIEKEPKKPESNQKKSASLIDSARERLESIPVQTILDRVRKELTVAMDVLGRGTERAKEQTVLMSKQARVQYDIYLLNNTLHKHLAELGGRVYELQKKHSKTLGLTDKKAIDAIEKIGDVENQIDALKAKARTLKKVKKTGKSNA
jgi:hypothetical protein